VGQLTRIDERGKLIAKLFEVNQRRLISLAPRTTSDPTRIFQVCFQHIAYNSDLLACTQESLIGGVFEAIKLGITLGGPMQEGWLIPFKEHGTPKATLIVGYQGYRNIIDRGRAVLDLHPRAVHKADEFDYYYGLNPNIIHKPKVPVLEEKDLRAVYVVANLRGGGRQFEVLEKVEIDQHRAKSRAKDSGPWVNFYVPMALKTGVRKIAKYLPKSNELLSRALQLDEEADIGKPQVLEVPTGAEFIAEDDPTTTTGSKLGQLKEALGVKPDAQ
jgi:recombination protein RecT